MDTRHCGNKFKVFAQKNLIKMKKDFIQDILINLLWRRKKKLADDKIMKKNEQNLSLIERNAYEEIIEREEKKYSSFGFSLTWFLIKISLCLFVFLFVFVYFYGNGIYNFKEIAEPLFLVFVKVILLGIVIDVLFIILSIIFGDLSQKKLKRELLLKKQ